MMHKIERWKRPMGLVLALALVVGVYSPMADADSLPEVVLEAIDSGSGSLPTETPEAPSIEEEGDVPPSETPPTAEKEEVPSSEVSSSPEETVDEVLQTDNPTVEVGTDIASATAPLPAEALELSAELEDADGTAVPLLDSGAAVAENWAYDETRTLRIRADFTDTQGARALTVSLPAGMVFVPGEYPTEATSELLSYVYTPCDLPAGWAESPAGGVLAYEVSDAAEVVELSITVRYDEGLWDKRPGESVTNSSPAITVEAAAGEERTTCVLSEARAPSTGKTYRPTAQDDPVATGIPLEEPVMLGFRGVSLARQDHPETTPPQYWSGYTLTQEAPYRYDEAGGRVYAEYEGAACEPQGGMTAYDPDTHTVTAAWEDVVFSYGQPRLNAAFRFPGDRFAVGDQAAYAQPRAEAVGLDGTVQSFEAEGDAEVILLGAVNLLAEPSSLVLTDQTGICKSGSTAVETRLVPAGSAEKASATGWAYTERRNLKITANFSGTTGERRIVVDVPIGVVFFANGYPTEKTNPNVIESCTYVPRTDEYYKINYGPKETGGTLTYLIKDTANQPSLSIAVGYDEQLWNKVSNTSVTADTTAIKVTASAGERTETYQLDEIVSSDAKADGYYNYYSFKPALTMDKPLDVATPIGLHWYYGGRQTIFNSTPDMFWRTLTFTQETPYKLVEGKKVYAEFVKLQANGKEVPVNYDEINHLAPFTYENHLFSYSSPQINGFYKFPSGEGKFAAGDTIVYPPPVILVKGLYGEEYQWSTGVSPERVQTFKLGDRESMVVVEKNASFNKVSTESSVSTVYPLTNLAVENQGAVDSASQRVTFTVTGTEHGVGVTTFRLPAPQWSKDGQQQIKVTYTCVNAEGQEVVYTGTQTLNLVKNNTQGAVLSRDDEMVENGYYFQTVSYTVNSFPAQTAFYEDSSPGISAGMVYGRLTSPNALKDATDQQELLTITLAIRRETETTVPEKAQLSQTVKAVKGGKREITLGLVDTEPLVDKVDTISAGGSIRVRATLETSSYPYRFTTSMVNPVYYLRLPKELSLEEGSLSTNRGVLPVVQASIDEKDASGNLTGYTITPITFNGEVPLGYYNEKLGAIDLKNGTEGTGKSLTLNFTLRASTEIKAITQYNLRDLVCASSKDAALYSQSGGWGIYNWAHNPTSSDGISQSLNRVTYSANTDVKSTFTVTAAAPMMEFEAAVKDHSAPLSAYGSGYTFVGQKGALDYRISFTNDGGGEVDGCKFYYILQIPKRGAVMTEHSGGGNPDFDLSLTGPIRWSSKSADLYDVRYSVEKPSAGGDNSFFNNEAADFDFQSGAKAAYLTAEEVTQNNQWGEVRCIKIVVKDQGGERVIPSGETCTITLSNVQWDASSAVDGQTMEWAACGLQRYVLDTASSEWHTPTNRVRFFVHPYDIDERATLTGVVGGKQAAGAVQSVTLTLPSYSEGRELKVKEITANGITLVTSQKISSEKTSANETWGNNHFSLSAKLGETGKPVDLLTGADTSIGTIKGNAPSGTKLTLTLGTVENLTTQSPAGTIHLVLTDAAGNPLNVQIDITIRTIGPEMVAGDVTAFVMQGKNFSGVTTGSGSDVIITADSSVSVVFQVNNYLQESYGIPTLQGDFPPGLSLILADVSDKNNPRYFYYRVEKEGASSILLTDFTSMADGASRLELSSFGVDSKLVVVVDYASASHTIIDATDCSLTLGFPSKDGSSGPSMTKTAQWKISPKRSVSLSGDKSATAEEKANITLTGTMSSAQLVGNDTNHAADFMTLALTLFDEAGTAAVPFPTGTVVMVNEMPYSAAENKVLASLGGAGIQNRSVTITIQTENWELAPGTYTLKVGLYFSPVDCFITPGSPENEQEVKLVVTEKAEYGLSVKLSSGESRLVPKGKETTLNFQLEYTADGSQTFAGELDRKVNGAYQKVAGVVPVIVASGGAGTGKVVLPRTLPAGTYRVLFTMTVKGETYQVPYNIIVA